jgi:hypothetical protein
MRRVLAFLSAVVMTVTIASPAQAERSYSWGDFPQPAGTVSVTIDDGVYESRPSYIEITKSFIREIDGAEIWTVFTQCDSLDSAHCSIEKASDANYEVFAELNMPRCEGLSEEFCIESVSVYDNGSTVTASEFLGYGSGPQVKAIPSLGLPAGSPVSLWSAQAEHSGGTKTYSVLARARFEFKAGKFEVTKLDVNVFPYLETSDPSATGFRWAEREDGTKTVQGFPNGEAWSKPGSRGVMYDFSPGTRVELKLRTPNQIKGWLKGRVTQPEFDSKVFSRTSNLLTLNAAPVLVPKIRVFATDAERSPKMIRNNMWSDKRQGAWDNLSTSAEGLEALDWIRDLRTVAKDRSTAEALVWQISATSWGIGACDAENQISGFVMTNSMGYMGTAPSFEGGFLSYSVAGMHFLSDGNTKAIGTYDLVLRSDIARCLYGYSKAPVSATVAVIGEDGAENIATTVVSEKDGWLKLAAYGFTFSEKEIKVKITQPQTRTLTNYLGRATALTAKQKAEIKATVTRGAGNSKFICTGIRLEGQPQALNTLVRKRAKLACDYAKSLNPKLSTFFQTKTTKARSFNGRVLVVSK